MNMKSKGASLYILNVPGVGMIEAHLNPSQALRFVASVETQLDEKIPRSLRVAPATIAEIETREAIKQAREALTRALNQTATGSTLADAISALDRALAIPSTPALELEPVAWDCMNWTGRHRYLRRTKPTDGNRCLPLYAAKGDTYQVRSNAVEAQGGKGKGFNYFRDSAITVLRTAKAQP
jgi:hypothetical protein